MLESYDFSPFHRSVNVTQDNSRDVTRDNSRDTTPHARAVNDPAVVQFLEKASLRHLLDIAQENILGTNPLSVLEIGGVSDMKK